MLKKTRSGYILFLNNEYSQYFCVVLTHDVDHDVPLVLALVVLEYDGVDAALLPPGVDHRQVHAVSPGQFKALG